MGSLFDGISGFPLASVRCGIEPIWASDIEPFPIISICQFPRILPTMNHIPMTNGRKFSVRVIRPYFLVAQIYSLRNTSAIASVFPA